MSAKDKLRRIRRINIRIEALNDAIAQVWAQATATTQRLGDSGGSSAGVSRRPESYTEKVDALKAQRDDLIAAKLAMIEMINSLQDNRYASLLLHYYVEGLTWEQTAEAMSYSVQHVIHVLHPAALNALDCLMVSNAQDNV